MPLRSVFLPLVSREWKNGRNSSYNCTAFLHSLLTKGKFLLLLVLCLLLMSAAATGASNHRNHNKKKAKQQQQQQAVRIAGSTSVEVRQEGKFLAIGTWWCKMLARPELATWLWVRFRERNCKFCSQDGTPIPY